MTVFFSLRKIACTGEYQRNKIHVTGYLTNNWVTELTDRALFVFLGSIINIEEGFIVAKNPGTAKVFSTYQGLISNTIDINVVDVKRTFFFYFSFAKNVLVKCAGKKVFLEPQSGCRSQTILLRHHNFS